MLKIANETKYTYLALIAKNVLITIVEINKIVTAAVVRADNAEAARHIVELPDQLNAHGIDLRVRTVAG